MFIFIVHPQASGQVDSTNKVILKGLKKNLDDTKGLWAELVHEIFWSYHITPHSTAKETVFTMVYEEYIIFSIEIDTPSL